ncbi:TrbC/VirB2 family protein, partial [Acinetobacter baumannii]
NTTALLMLVLVALAMPDMAWAGTGSNPIENGINSAISFINSAVIRGLGILAVFSLGVAAYLGKMSWDLSLKIVAGIILTFGSAGIVDLISAWAYSDHGHAESRPAVCG